MIFTNICEIKCGLCIYDPEVQKTPVEPVPVAKELSIYCSFFGNFCKVELMDNEVYFTQCIYPTCLHNF